MKKRMTPKPNLNQDGERRYQQWSQQFESDPQLKTIYAEESVKLELWLQLTEARHAAGLTQAELAERLGVSQVQVSRMEKRGYDRYTLNSLRRYIQALGADYALEVVIRRRAPRKKAQPAVAHL